MENKTLTSHSSSELQNDRGNDVTDAGPDESFSHSVVSNNDNLQSPLTSTGSISAGDALCQFSPKVQSSSSISSQLITGGDVLRNFQPETYSFDPKVSSNKVPKYSDESSTNDFNEFTVEGASAAVKHFFPEYENQLRSKADEVDNDDVESPASPSFKNELGVTTHQTHDVSTKKQRQETAHRYNMNHNSRGCFVIFNIETYAYHLKLPNREGSKKDAKNLENMADQLGFEFIRTIDNPTKSRIIELVNMLASAKHDDYDCFGCAILTHGGDKDVLYAHDSQMKLSDFTRPFGPDNCPSLAGKPKLFFIQACRGDLYDKGGSAPCPKMETDHAGSGRSKVVTDGKGKDVVDGGGENTVTIPAGADFLIANSTIPEYYSFRNKTNGSIFVQNVCAVFNSFGDSLELMQLMTRVNYLMAYEFESDTDNANSNAKKQIPSIATRLTGEVYFPPKRRFPTESYDDVKSKSKMKMDNQARSESASSNSEQGSNAVSMREASCSSQEAKQKSIYPRQLSKTEEIFKPSAPVQESSSEEDEK